MNPAGYKKVIVLGAGPLGLSVGANINRNMNIPVVFIDGSESCGGLARTFSWNGLRLEYYYHFFYSGDSENVTNFLTEFVRLPDITWKNISTSTYFDGKKHNFDSLFDLLKLCKWQSLRVFYTLLKLKFLKLDHKLDQVSALDWSQKKFGSFFSNRVWEVLLRDKFSSGYNKVSALWLATRIKRHLSTKSSGGQSKFGYLNDTYSFYFDLLEISLKNKSCTFNYNKKIKSLVVKDSKIVEIIFQNDKYIVDNDTLVISTLPLASLSGLLDQYREFNYLQEMSSIGVVVLILIAKRCLSEDYWITVTDERIPFNLIISQYNLYPEKGYIHYISKYTETTSDLYLKPDKLIYEEFCAGIKTIIDDFELNDVIDFKIVRSSCAAPVPSVNSESLVPGFNTPCDNFYHAGFEQIYPEDRGVGNSIQLGIRLSEHICKNQN